MKKIAFLIFLVIYYNAYSQDQKKMQNQIDSLKLIRTEYEKKIQQINTVIKEVENTMTIKQFENFESLKYEIPAQPIVRIREKDNSSGKIIFEPKKGDVITLIDFDDNTDYWLVSFNNTTGYVNEVLLQQSSAIDDYKKYLVAKRVQKIEEDKKVAAENEKKVVEIKKLETQKLEEKRILDEQKRDEEAKRLVLEAKKMEGLRKASLTKKYGSTIANKILAGKIWIGMTDEMARESWGSPEKNNRSVGSWGVHEQWVYPNDVYLYFENSILTSWQD